MKNKHKFFTLVCSTLIFIGCETGEIPTESTNPDKEVLESASNYSFSVIVKNDMLSFDTREDYDRAIEYLGPLDTEGFIKWESSQGFKSMRSQMTEGQRHKRGIFDDLLATLINPEAMIEIAGNVFKLDALNESVYVINANSYNNKMSLSSKTSQTFSTNDDVLDILEGTAERESLTERRYCRKNRLSWRPVTQVFGKVVYQKAGFLNSLVANLRNDGGISETRKLYHLKFETVGNNFWRNKKRSGTIPSYGGGTNFTTNAKSYRPYYASRRLKSYRFSVRFYAQYNTGTLHNRVVTISCN